jgi:hypothetical protein
MAESTRRKGRAARDDEATSNGDDQPLDEAAEEQEESNGPEGDADGPRLSAKELTDAGREAITELTELEPESVTGLEWDGESWLVTVDVLELSRIPETTDVIATYVVQLDPSGSLLGYRRTRRYVRGQVEGE